jgi:hypothetical protein
MKVVFLSGPYFGDSQPATIEANIQEARQWALAMARKRVGFFCPHLNSAHFGSEPGVPDEAWFLEMCLSVLLGCDALLAMPRWRESKGARVEMKRPSEWVCGSLCRRASRHSTSGLTRWTNGSWGRLREAR